MPLRNRRRWSTLIAGALLMVCVDVAAAERNWIPKGHYLSFARERDLSAEILEPLAAPAKAGNYRLNVARELDRALQTPGVKGFYMHFRWRTLEPSDGVFDWRLLDANMAVARHYGLRFIVQVSDRSFDGTNVLPEYFPSKYVLWSTGSGNAGVVAKRWDPYVYNRQIRLYKAIAARYANEPMFGGISTSETATGDFSGGDYSSEKYRHALTQIVTQTQAALPRGRFFLYLNFLRGGTHIDMNQDARVQLLRDVPHDKLLIGGPDLTPDVEGMQGSVNSYRIHARKTMPTLGQFCHLQHVDQGFQGINVKTNEYRQKYYAQVAAARERESQSWFRGTPAVFEFDDLGGRNGGPMALHPAAELGKLWHPEELLHYGVRNFGCDYALWHYREWTIPNGFDWPEIRAVIEANRCFYAQNGCDGVRGPRPPSLR